jgi:hypothetical protein
MSATFATNTSAQLSRESGTSRQNDPAEERLILRIALSSVCMYKNTLSSITTAQHLREAYEVGRPSDEPDGFLDLLQGKLCNFIRFAGDGADDEKASWLIDMAHDICDPYLKRGQLWLLDRSDRTDRWVFVSRTDSLVASIYVYRVPSPISLTKISERIGKTKTKSTGHAKAMRARVLDRDGRCWVTAGLCPVINSHICPKRMGNFQGQKILAEFAGIPMNTQGTILDTQFGIALTHNLDNLFDYYKLGFRATAPVRFNPLHCVHSDVSA